jgi:hypothetical protein
VKEDAVSKSTIARIVPPEASPTVDDDPLAGALDLDRIARRLRTIAQALYDDVGEALAGCEEADDVYPHFEIMLGAIRTEAARLDKKAVA